MPVPGHALVAWLDRRTVAAQYTPLLYAPLDVPWLTLHCTKCIRTAAARFAQTVAGTCAFLLAASKCVHMHLILLELVLLGRCVCAC